MKMTIEHSNSNPKIRSVPESTPEEIAFGRQIVLEELGPDFQLYTEGLPRNVGAKGDMGIWGETVLISSSDEALLADLYSPAGQERLAELSTKLTNTMPAVTRVLIDIEVQA